MTTAKHLLLEFYPLSERPKSDGLKFCLFKCTKEDGELIGYDYGFVNYTEGEFEMPENAADWVLHVYLWCQLPAPKLLF